MNNGFRFAPSPPLVRTAYIIAHTPLHIRSPHCLHGNIRHKRDVALLSIHALGRFFFFIRVSLPLLSRMLSRSHPILAWTDSPLFGSRYFYFFPHLALQLSRACIVLGLTIHDFARECSNMSWFHLVSSIHMYTPPGTSFQKLLRREVISGEYHLYASPQKSSCTFALLF